MVVLKIILGVLMIMGSFSILTMPVLSSVAICWIISIFMFIAGIVAIISYIENKNAEKVAARNGHPTLKTGIGSLVFGIIAIVVSILARSSLIGAAVFMQIISIIFGLWLALSGVSFVVCGSELKKQAAPGWVAMMIMGVLVAIAGVACIVNCFAGLTAVGTMFGISMMMTGISLMFSE